MDIRHESRGVRTIAANIEIAWAAGFFDGEGSTVCARQKGATRSLQLVIHQVNRDNLLRFRAALGGLGRIGEPYDRVAGRPISRYAAYGAAGHAALRLLFPFLGKEKQDQGLRALVAYSFRSVNNRAGAEKCHRGHVYAEVGAYLAPGGARECIACRSARRRGPQPKPTRRLAIQDGIGVRQYNPRVYWPDGTPRLKADQYAPAVQT